MNFERKKARAIAILEGKKMRRRKYAPLFLRVLWRMGFKIPPLPCPALRVVLATHPHHRHTLRPDMGDGNVAYCLAN
jgi:hypothetical protein